MKKVLSVLVAVLLIAVACVPAFAAQQATISAPDTAAVGDTITVSVVSPAGLNGLTVNFTYDTAYFTLVSYEAANLYNASINSPSAGIVKFAGAASSAVAGGTAFTVTLKVKKAGGTVRTAVVDALDASDNDVTSSFTAATKTIAAGTTTTKATTTKAAGTTSAAAGTTSAAGKNPSIPKTGGSVSVAASSAAVLVMAAAVAYAMKKKNNEE